MLHLLALALIGAGIWVGIHVLPLVLIGGAGLDDLRNLILHRAFQSFTFEGDVIPGVRPPRAARLVILMLSHDDDARRVLVAKAMGSPARRRPRAAAIRVLLRICARLHDGSGRSRALRDARWFSAPPLGAQFRARSFGRAAASGW